MKNNRLAALVAFAALLPALAGCTAGAGGSGQQVTLLITPVPTPTATSPAQPTAAPVTYTIKAGDTLSGIADLFGVTVDDIVRANNMADPNALQVGQVLTIPARGSLPTPTGTATPLITPSPAGALTPVLPPPDVTPPMGPTTTVAP